ncbi:Ig-like domain-containing protein [Pendulispora albinea]|uniref:Ig-like domain-containing protein n=1 Tax=Pendulispora albinea TaxID=2741071 RepID=A0ABZ2LTW5_9BACT
MMNACVGVSVLGATALLVFAVVTSSCGSDDAPAGPRDGGPDGIVVQPPDTVPPEIRFRMPADAEEQVWVRNPIRAVFSEPVKLGKDPITLLANGIPIPASASLSDDANVLTIVPKSELPVPATVSVSFGDIEDLHGNALVKRPWSWKAPLWVRVGDPLKNDGFKSPPLAAGPGERISVLMGVPGREGDLDPPLSLWSSERTTSPWRQSPADGIGASSEPPTLLIDKDGVRLMSHVTSDGAVIVKRYTEGRGWSDIGGDFRSVQSGSTALAVDADGILFLAYDESLADDETNVVVRTLPRGATSWSSLGKSVNDSSTEKGARLRSLTIDKNGKVYVAFRSKTLDGHVRSWSGTAWIPVGMPLNGGGESALETSIATNDDATLFALVSFSDRNLARWWTRILRFDGNNWTNHGPDITRGAQVGSLFFAPMRGNRLFAYMSVNPELAPIEVNSSGWVSIRPPAAATSPDGRLAAGGATIDPEGVPVIGWADNGILSVARLNR